MDWNGVWTYICHPPANFTVRALYLFFICLYYLVARVIAVWNKKAASWINGRKAIFPDLNKTFRKEDKIIWVHCSSAGEFEQGKPFIEGLKNEYPSFKIVVSFYSPSGYEVSKNYPFADVFCYLPLDTPENARRFLDMLNPALVVFVKYDYWYFHLKEIRRRNIPLLLVSAVFRDNQPFFNWYGQFFKNMLRLFTWIFVQDKTSEELLKNNNILNCSVAGDTRFDRVSHITDNKEEIPCIADFIKDQPCLVAGSTWGEDEKFLSIIREQQLKMIIAPHVISDTHLNDIKELFPKAAFYSSIQDNLDAQVLIIDNVGMLSRLYRYATITYVGGGFTRDGVHNVLEPAVYGKPVIYGNNYQKYREAIELVKTGGAFHYTNAEELASIITKLLQDSSLLTKAGSAAKNYVEDNIGATKKILSFIYEKRLLTK